jgi:cephalosporin hydroxylase
MELGYPYNFDWMGRPIIQYPQDIVAVQELIWSVKPDLVIETGIAHGGSLILSASILALLELADASEAGELLDPSKPKRKVIGVDIDIRDHNRERILGHPMASRIEMIEGSSIAEETVAKVAEAAKGFGKVMVFLDSMHTHDHVMAELEAYAPMVSPGSYCVVFDSFVEDMPENFFSDRPWDVGNNPRTALREFLGRNADFEIDRDFDSKLLVSVAPEGYLRRRG